MDRNARFRLLFSALAAMSSLGAVTACAPPGSSSEGHGTWILKGDQWRLASTGGSNDPETLAGIFGIGVMTTDPAGHAFLPTEGWEWNGRGWLARVPPPTGGPELASTAYDPDEKRLYAIADTFQANERPTLFALEGGTWTPLELPAGVSAGDRCVIAWDETASALVLVATDTTSNTSTTWTYRGASWTLKLGRTPPGNVMLFDPTSGRLVMWRQDCGQAWSWDGSTWSLLSQVPNSPRPYDSVQALALDRSAGFVEAFAVVNGSVRTSRWTGHEWMVEATHGGPPPDGQLSAGYDAVSGNVVLIDVVGPDQVLGTPPTAVSETPGGAQQCQ